MDLSDPVAITAAWRFVPAGEGYIYYPAVGAKGLRVTAAEREVFINGTAEQWYRAIEGREATEPPMSYPATLRHRLGAWPIWLHGALALIGLLALKNGYVGLSQSAGDRAPAIMSLVVGAVLSIFGLIGALLSRLGQGRNIG